MSAEIRAVSFDVGNTLIEIIPSVGYHYQSVANQFGLDISAEKLERAFAAAWSNRPPWPSAGGGQAERLFWRNLVEAVFSPWRQSSLPEAMHRELYDIFVKPEIWRVYQEVHEVLKKIKIAGMRLGIISNWDSRLRGLLVHLGLADYFDFMAISSAVGFSKPHKEIFAFAQTAAHCAPEHILHIGDHAREDYEGALQAGFQALLLRRGEQVPANDSVISSLTGVLLRIKGGDNYNGGE